MKKNLIIVFSAVILASCSKFILQPANFAWPIETVLKTDNSGNVKEERFSFSVNTSSLFKLEFGETAEFSGKEIRIIRDNMGYYYFVSPGFKNVYLFKTEEGKMILETKILINEKGISKPIFNQKETSIELLDESAKYNLNYKGIEGK